MGKKQRVDPVPPKEDGEHIHSPSLDCCVENKWSRVTDMRNCYFKQIPAASCTLLVVLVLQRVSFSLTRTSALQSLLFISYSFTYSSLLTYILVRIDYSDCLKCKGKLICGHTLSLTAYLPLARMSCIKSDVQM